MFFQIVLISLILLLIGSTFCFSGYRFFRFLIPLWGFVAGFSFATTGIQDIFGGGFLATVISWVLGLFVGIIFGAVAYLYYVGAVIILAGSVGYLLAIGLLAGFGVQPNFLTFLIGLVFALVAATLTVYWNLPKILIIILSAIAGATTIITALLLAVGRISLTNLQYGEVGGYIRNSWFWLLLTIILAGIGIATQWRSTQTYIHSEQRQTRSILMRS